MFTVQGKVCGSPEKSISLEKHKVLLAAMVGKTSGTNTIKTNNGNSCFKFNYEMIFDRAAASKSFVQKLPMVG